MTASSSDPKFAHKAMHGSRTDVPPGGDSTLRDGVCAGLWLLGKKRFGCTPQQCLLLLEGQAAQLSPGLNAPAA